MNSNSSTTSSSNIRSYNFTDGTESTHTQSDLISPAMRSSITIGNFTNIHRCWPTKSVSHAKYTHKPFRKCQSFVHLSKTSSDRVQSSLINHESTTNNDHLIHKSSSSASAIYTTIKQEHRYLVYRIFSRCKVVCFEEILFR